MDQKRRRLYPTRIEQDKIRLVCLHPAQNWQDDISCDLYCLLVDSEDRKPAQYKALSYVWGSPRVKRPIVVNGGSVMVTVNLESALRHLRQPDRNVILWIDALVSMVVFKSSPR